VDLSEALTWAAPPLFDRVTYPIGLLLPPSIDPA
jgi:hypothetical protein